MKPEIVPHFICPDGKGVRTVAEWRDASVAHIMKDIKEPLSPMGIIGCIIEHADELIDVLSYKRAGRPKGAKDAKPRKKPATATVAAPAA